MYYRHDELALLTRGGRLPPPAPPPRRPADHYGAERDRSRRSLRGAARWLGARCPVAVMRPAAARSRIDIHEYLELEFTIDERR